MKSVVAVAVLACVSCCVQAGPGAWGAAEKAAEAAPLVSDETLAVIFLDVSKLEMRAVKPWVLERYRLVGAKAKWEVSVRESLHALTTSIEEHSERFRKAGGRRVYGVLWLEDGGALNGAAVIPLMGEAQVAGMKAFLNLLWRDVEWSPEATWVSAEPKAIVLGSKAAVEHLKSTKPKHRKELGEALAAADGPCQIVLLMTPLARLMMPNQGWFSLQGASPRHLCAELLWATAGFGRAPDPSCKVVGQYSDERAAVSVEKTLLGGLEKLRKEQPAARKSVEIITPKRKGTQLVLELNHDDADVVFRELLASAVRHEVQTALRLQSWGNMRRIHTALGAYQAKHKAWPASLDEMRKELADAAILVNPQDPQRAVGYIYIRPEGNIGPDAILLHEAYDEWPGSLYVLYGDGQVLERSDEAAFKRELQQMKQTRP